MALSSGFLLKLKRAETPFYRFLKRAVQRGRSASLPVPRVLKPGFRFLYELHFVLLLALRWCRNFFYCQPLFRARGAEVGKNFRMELMPFVYGPVEIHIGDDVALPHTHTLASFTLLCFHMRPRASPWLYWLLLPKIVRVPRGLRWADRWRTPGRAAETDCVHHCRNLLPHLTGGSPRGTEAGTEAPAFPQPEGHSGSL